MKDRKLTYLNLKEPSLLFSFGQLFNAFPKVNTYIEQRDFSFKNTPQPSKLSFYESLIESFSSVGNCLRSSIDQFQRETDKKNHV